ncbi:MAG TPA: hypothetical protein VGC09_00485 [Rhodopila sp.]
MSGTTTTSGGNPQVDQGTINRLRQSLIVPDLTTLNITASFLGRGAIRWEPEGQVTDEQQTLTGVVQSPAPYVMVNVTANLLRTQALASRWRAQMESLSTIGQIVVTCDTTSYQPLPLFNCAIRAAPGADFAGTDASYNVVIRGVYQVNSSLFAGI